MSNRIEQRNGKVHTVSQVGLKISATPEARKIPVLKVLFKKKNNSSCKANY
jgi:hypothetical protein